VTEPRTPGDQDVVPGPQRWWPRGWRAVVLGLLAVLFVGLGLYQADRDSLTLDEGVDLSAGLTALVHHDAGVLPEHPLLPKVLNAAPALLADPIVPDGEARRTGDSFGQSDELVSANLAADRLDRVVLLARLVPLLISVLVALVLHALAARSFGPRAGFVAATLWLTTPVVLGLGHLATIDVPFTLAAALVVLGLLRLVERPDPRRAVELGILVGLALATRHTALVLALVAVGVAGWTLRADRRRALVAVGLVAAFAIGSLWVVYRVVAPSGPTGAARERLEQIESAGAADSVAARAISATPTPLEWRAGFSYLVLTSGDKPSYLLGQAWDGARWWYVPGSVLVKLPATTVALLVLGPLAIGLAPVDLRRRLALCLGLPAAALLLFTMAQPLALGVRLVLPVLALLMVAASAATLIRHRAARVAVGAVLVVQGVALVASAPHSIAWTTPPFVPPYVWASDSNVDFGQDLRRLDDWSQDRSPWVSVARARGLELPEGSRPLADADPDELTGWVAVGASNLTRGQRDELAWLRRWCPVDTIGGSILIYRFEEPPGDRPGPDRPAGPCFDQTWSSS
jgi:Dolichyl-phosphate-mannose-protein mannosyltransferase